MGGGEEITIRGREVESKRQVRGDEEGQGGGREVINCFIEIISEREEDQGGREVVHKFEGEAKGEVGEGEPSKSKDERIRFYSTSPPRHPLLLLHNIPLSNSTTVT